jgi:metallo-beta-lactamase family protein
MQITCLGAARCVTGSCYLIDNGGKYLIDCGLFQGGRQMEAMNHTDWGFNPAEISALFLTHAHIDHSGRIPKLVKDGFRGKIYSTIPTLELVKILLLDSAHIQEMEAEWQTRKNKRRGDPVTQPLYTLVDAEACFPLFEPVKRDEIIKIAENLNIRFRNSGHILGSSYLEIWEGPLENARKTIFSGDLGYKGQMILEDPEIPTSADTLFIESTYGNRNHKPMEESEKELLKAIQYSYSHGEKVLIPAFAVERTQELLFILGKFFREGRIPTMPVYVDSPLAIAATTIFRNMKQFYDAEAREMLARGNDPFDFPQLILSKTAEESMAINQTHGPAIIIAGNGMCTAGRIRHHLKHNLWRPGCSLVIVGFQAAGSLGRSLVEGVRLVKILGERVIVRAKVFTIGGLSAHADQNALFDWLGHFENRRMRVYVVHGEESVSEEFAKLIRQKFGFETHVPAIGDRITPTALERPAVYPKAGAAEEPTWREYVAKLLQKAEEIRRVLEDAGKPVSPHMIQRLEDELISAEAHLDEALQSVEKADHIETTTNSDSVRSG